MKWMMVVYRAMNYVVATSLMVGLALVAEPAAAQSSDRAQTLDLAKKTQNPVADLISVPFQSNFNFGYGAKNSPEPSSTQYVLNIQPVVPIGIGEGWNLITRPIIPIDQPDLLQAATPGEWGTLRYRRISRPHAPAR
jgi:hypothetical protein